MKENVIEARKDANPEIMLHEFKRDIEVKKITLREELEERKYPFHP
jgi:serine/arginine repetitive matrix protein 2